MRRQMGKFNISSILIIIIIGYGAFVAFKFISSRVTKTQIKTEILEKIGYIRGMDFTPEKGEEIIRRILIDHNLYTENVGEGEGNENVESFETKVKVELQQAGSKIWLAVEYMDKIDLLLFKTRMRYNIEEEMLNYN